MVRNPVAADAPPSFIKKPSSSTSPPLYHEDESGRVASPADEAAAAETREVSPQTHELVERDDAVGGDGMDIGLVELHSLMAVLGRDEKEAVAAAEQDIMAVLKSLGGNGSKLRRERGRAFRAVVSEIYSPPRVTKAASKVLPELGVIPGFALDVTTADAHGELWDFDRATTIRR